MHENEIYSSITISFRYISQLLSSPPTLFTMLLCVSFNGILTDINRSRDEWRLTLKYYACRLPSSPLFWFSLSLTKRSESLRQSSALCQEHKRINYIQYQWWDFNDSDSKRRHYILSNLSSAHLSNYTRVCYIILILHEATKKIKRLLHKKLCQWCLNFPQVCTLRWILTSYHHNLISWWF